MSDAPLPARTLPTAARRAGALTLLRRPRALWRFLRDPRAPKLPRLFAVLTLLYVLFPFDVAPDVVPVLGWLDDLGLTGAAIAYIAARAARYENDRADAAPPNAP